MKYWITVAALLLAGCGTDPFVRLNTDLPAYIGQPVKVMVDRIGYPSDERIIMGDKLYTWSTSHIVQFDIPTFQTTTGNVNGDPFYATTQGSETETIHANCTIQVAVDGAGIIKHTQWHGNRAGCGRYAQALARE